MPDRLHFTDSDEANALIAKDPMALLIGFALDQQVSVEKAFSGPLALQQRLGTLDPTALAEADLDSLFREKPAIHRFPSSMAKRVRELAIHIRDLYGGDAAAVWEDAPDPETLEANLRALPGFGDMKVGSLAAVLAKRYGVTAAKKLMPAHPTLADVDSAESLATYKSGKKAQKLAMRSSKS
jgi:uncharacterized HhH-GPD family protein